MITVPITVHCELCDATVAVAAQLHHNEDRDGRDILAIPEDFLGHQLREMHLRPWLRGWVCESCARKNYPPEQFEASR